MNNAALRISQLLYCKLLSLRTPTDLKNKRLVGEKIFVSVVAFYAVILQFQIIKFLYKDQVEEIRPCNLNCLILIIILKHVSIIESVKTHYQHTVDFLEKECSLHIIKIFVSVGIKEEP